MSRKTETHEIKAQQASLDLHESKPSLIAGVDEAGRGPLAGPVFAAAVILHPDMVRTGLVDSKVMTPAARASQAERIRAEAWAWSVACASVAEIDQLNILQATLLAMRRAVLALPARPDWVRVDGNRLPRLPMAAEAIVQGDALFAEISAASILAKEAQVHWMMQLHLRHPEYGFGTHSGYGTAVHRAQLLALGPTADHRRSFAPVREALAAFPDRAGVAVSEECPLVQHGGRSEA